MDIRAVQTAPDVAPDSSDRELVVLVARGDRTALASLYTRHAGALLSLAGRLLRDPRESEDFLHEVFLEVWRRAGEYDPERATPLGWMLMMTRSRCLDRLRSAYARRSVLLAEPPEPEARPTVDDRADHRRLLSALIALRPEQREVLELAYFDGLSSSEMAVRLELPLGTIKSRTRLALEHLRRELHGRPQVAGGIEP